MTCDVTRVSVATGRQLIAQVMFRTRNKASDIPHIGVVSPNKTVPGTDWVRGCMKSRDCLNALLLRSYCARPSSSQSLYRPSYAGSLRVHKETCNYAIKVKEVPQDCCNAVTRILKNSINWNINKRISLYLIQERILGTKISFPQRLKFLLFLLVSNEYYIIITIIINLGQKLPHVALTEIIAAQRLKLLPT